MKIIDEKGRLFGKINVIDFLALFFIFALLPMFYFGYKIFIGDRPLVMLLEEKETVRVELPCRLVQLKPQIVELILVGDKELDDNMEVIGEIIEFGKISPHQYEFMIGGGKKILKEVPTLKQAEAKLRLSAEVEGNKLYYKDRELSIGSPLEFKTDKYTITAILLAEEETKYDRVVDLYITLKDLDKNTLEKIAVGDKQVDKNGDTIAEILNLGAIQKNSVDFDLGSGSFIRGEYVERQQIFTKMRLRCKVGDNKQIYFKDKLLGRDTYFEFKTDKYTAKAMLSKSFQTFASIQKKWVTLQVKLSEVLPEIAKIIQEEDIEKDPFENIVARLKLVIANKAAPVLTLKGNAFVMLEHPLQRDILIHLDVLCMEKEGIFYFKNYPVKIGNNITFTTDLYSVSGVIVGMEVR